MAGSFGTRLRNKHMTNQPTWTDGYGLVHLLDLEVSVTMCDALVAFHPGDDRVGKGLPVTCLRCLGEA